MKKLIVTTLATVASLAAFAQGTINFANLSGSPALNAPVYDGLNTTVKLAGTTYQAGLYAGSSAASLAYVGNSTPFLTGTAAGWFNGGTTVLNGIAGGATAWLQVYAWDTTLHGTTTGATLAQAMASGIPDVYGSSGVFSVVSGNPTASPPTTPAVMVGMNSFSLIVPEPSTFALAGLGAAALMIFRRRK